MSEPQGDPTNGKKVFARNCQNCHNASAKGKHGIGPLLGTVWGRKIASAKGFKYSAALSAKKGEAWGYENMDAWLENPGGYASGTSMAFAGLKSQKDRDDVIRYLYECNPKNKKKK